MKHTIEPLVVSSTHFAAFKRCRKSFEYGFVRQLDVPSSEAAELGTSLHHLLALVAQGDRAEIQRLTEEPMYPIVLEYLRHRGLPGETVFVEEPLYTLVIPEEEIAVLSPTTHVMQARLQLMPAVYMRTTFDRVFKLDDWLFARDYKSFDKSPTLYIDLDFQGKMQTAALQRYFRHDQVQFEWEYIRREIGRELKGKGYVEWEPDERYINVPIVTARHEMTQIWKETQDVARDLVRAIAEARYYREDLKAGPHSCSSCFFKQLCAAEFAQGVLTADDLDMFTVPRDPLARMTKRGMVSDPRVKWQLEECGMDEWHAIAHYYGEQGAESVVRGPQPQMSDLGVTG